MLIQKDGNEILVKLEKGEDVLATLTDIIEKNGVKSGEIVWGLGRIRDFQIGYFNGKDYDKTVVDETVETVSFCGSITVNEPRFHIHTSGAKSDYSVVGGHLFGGVADPLLEVKIRRFDNITAERYMNPKTGLRELKL